MNKAAVRLAPSILAADFARWMNRWLKQSMPVLTVSTWR
jgi:hypothetical protein